jgi:GNAT superfamily N-acetyltransferase
MNDRVTSGQDSVRFRYAGRDDIRSIVAMLADDVLGDKREGTDRQDLSVYLKAFDDMAAQGGNRYLLAEDRDGAILGCVQIVLIPGLSRTGMKRAQVEGVRVAKSARGLGIGGQLMAEVQAIAMREGCGLIQLTTDRSRADAHRFYESIGYVNSHRGLKLAL